MIFLLGHCKQIGFGGAGAQIVPTLDWLFAFLNGFTRRFDRSYSLGILNLPLWRFTSKEDIMIDNKSAEKRVRDSLLTPEQLAIQVHEDHAPSERRTWTIFGLFVAACFLLFFLLFIFSV
ncbi:MAG: hypothetical protein A2233_02825 [Candidatus Kerfeldbacteria bacterium RIFOXYA2_FULL_38_24]|nr:MAG: hypothetical protein A2233_02825 [Candidatus Kerfeldbacteria bacterium RIFOXYA2_FULL_38_24]